MSVTLNVRATVEVPKVPNFLRLSDGQTVPLSAVKEDDLRVLGALWTNDLVARAAEQVKDPDALKPREERDDG